MLVFFNVKKDGQRKSQVVITYLTSLLHDDTVLRDSEVVWNNLMLNIRWGGSEVAEADMAFGEVWTSRYEYVREWEQVGSEHSRADWQCAAWMEVLSVLSLWMF